MKVTKKMVGMMAEAREGGFHYIGIITTIYSNNVYLRRVDGDIEWNFWTRSILRVWHAPREPAPVGE